MEEYRGIFLIWIVIYLVLIQAVGYWASRQINTSEDYMLFNRNLNPHLGAATWTATFISALTLLGFVGSIHASGYFFIGAVVTGLIIGNVIAYIVTPKLRARNATTLGDVLVKTIGSRWSQPVAGLVQTFDALTFLVMQLLGISLILSFILGWGYLTALTVVTIAFLFYTVAGGLRAVAWTDLVQAVLLILGTIAVTVGMITKVGGLTAMHTILAREMGPNYLRALPEGMTVWGFFVAMIAFTVLFTQQGHIIRINASPSVKAARLMIAESTAVITVYYLFLIMFLGGATQAYVATTGLEIVNQDTVVLEVVADTFAPWMSILVMLTLMSGILSTTDSRLHDLGITTVRDFYRTFFRKDAKDAHYLFMSRVFTVCWGIVAYIIAIDPPGAIIEIYNARSILLASALLVPVLISLYSRRISPAAGVWAMSLGLVSGFILFLLPVPPLGIAPAFGGVLVSLIVWVVLSPFLPKQDAFEPVARESSD